MTNLSVSGFRASARDRLLAARDELGRPLPLALAAAAALGWILVIGLALSASAQRAELARNEATRNELAGELERHRQASGRLADLQAKIATAEGELARLNQPAEKKNSSRRARGR